MQAKHVSSRKHFTYAGHDAVKHTFTVEPAYRGHSTLIVSQCNDTSCDPIVVYGTSDEYGKGEQLFSLYDAAEPARVLAHIGYTLEPCDLPKIPEKSSARFHVTFRPGDILIATEHAESFGLKAGDRVRVESMDYRERMTVVTCDDTAREIEAHSHHPGFRPARYRWTVEIEVASVWVADGFDLTDERALGMLEKHLGYAYSHELGASVTAKPDPEDIAREQGYKSAAERAERSKRK